MQRKKPAKVVLKPNTGRIFFTQRVVHRRRKSPASSQGPALPQSEHAAADGATTRLARKRKNIESIIHAHVAARGAAIDAHDDGGDDDGEAAVDYDFENGDTADKELLHRACEIAGVIWDHGPDSSDDRLEADMMYFFGQVHCRRLNQRSLGHLDVDVSDPQRLLAEEFCERWLSDRFDQRQEAKNKAKAEAKNTKSKN